MHTSHSILTSWGKYFSQLFNVHGVNDVRQTEIHSVEAPVPDPSAFEAEVAVGKLRSHKSPIITRVISKEMHTLATPPN